MVKCHLISLKGPKKFRAKKSRKKSLIPKRRDTTNRNTLVVSYINKCRLTNPSNIKVLTDSNYLYFGSDIDSNKHFMSLSIFCLTARYLNHNAMNPGHIMPKARTLLYINYYREHHILNVIITVFNPRANPQSNTTTKTLSDT